MQKADQESRSWMFFGRVLPERVPLNFEIPLGSFEVTEWGLKFEIGKVFISNSQFICDVHVSAGNPDLNTLKNLVNDKIRLLCDVIGFAKGICFDLDIVSAFCCETGECRIFDIGIPALVARKGGATGKKEELSSDTFRAALSERALEFALADFREAMMSAIGTGFHCFRALEALMRSMRAPNKDGDDIETKKTKDREAWVKMAEVLNIDRSAGDYIKDRADERRHGLIPTISDKERAKVFLITNEIIERYFKFVIGNKKALDKKQYPLLQDASF